MSTTTQVGRIRAKAGKAADSFSRWALRRDWVEAADGMGGRTRKAVRFANVEAFGHFLAALPHDGTQVRSVSSSTIGGPVIQLPDSSQAQAVATSAAGFSRPHRQTIAVHVGPSTPSVDTSKTYNVYFRRDEAVVEGEALLTDRDLALVLTRLVDDHTVAFTGKLRRRGATVLDHVTERDLLQDDRELQIAKVSARIGGVYGAIAGGILGGIAGAVATALLN